MQEINVEQIMQGIREDVEKKNIQEPPVRFSEISSTKEFELPKTLEQDVIRKEIMHLNAIWDTTPALEIKTNSKMKRIIKRIINKFVFLSVRANIDAQNLFNYSVVNLMSQMNCLVEENEKMKTELQQLREEMAEMKKERA